ncbi:MAG: DUF4340 domain-containing protein [Opitutaceae bacterium]|nr:DUF4340 domain-containing protein [Opitutaceae bacterium]
MRTKVTLVLVFLNVALFFFIFKFERHWRTERASLEARKRVLGPETADIRELTLGGPGLTTIRLTRSGGDWSLAEPIAWPANPHAVNRIVNELQFLDHETSFRVADLAKNDQSLADYGLAEPRLTVTFSSGEPGSRPPLTLRIGDETKVGNRLYILSPDGERIHVVSQGFARSMALDLAELRADTLFTIPVFEARSLALQNAANVRVRIRREAGRWAFEAPIVARANKTATELAINALNNLRVHSFLPADTATVASTPSLRISLQGNNRSETLLLGAELGTTAMTGASGGSQPDVEFQAALEGKSAAFTVVLPAALLDALRNAQEVLRETRLLEFDPGTVTRITLAAPDTPPVTLQRDPAAPAGAPWQLLRRTDGAGTVTRTADADAIADLLNELGRLAAQKFQSDAPSDADLENWGFNRPEREITLTLNPAQGAARTLTLQVGVTTPRDDRAYARLAGERFIYGVDPAILDETVVSPLAYRERLLQELPAATRITALRIVDLNDDTTISEHDLTAVPADSPAARLAAQLRKLRAAHFVLDEFADTFAAGGEDRTWRYRLDATLALPGGATGQTETFTLYLSERIGGGLQIAGSAELAAVFAVEQPLLDALWAVTYAGRDPGPPAPPAAP